MYAELHSHSWFSLLEGAASPREMIKRAKTLGYQAVAVCDRESMSGAVEASQAAAELGMPLIIGATVSVAPWTEHTWEPETAVVLCKGVRGYGALCELLSEAFARRTDERGPACLSLDDLASLDDVFTLIGHESSAIARLIDNGYLDEAEALLKRWSDAIPAHNLLISLQDHGLPIEERRVELLSELAARFKLPTVVTQGALYAEPRQRRLQDVLTALRRGQTLDAAAPALRPNANWGLRQIGELQRARAGWAEAMARSVEVARACTNPIAQLNYQLPTAVPGLSESAECSSRLLRERAWEGAKTRYLTLSDAVKRQLEHELKIIKELGFCSYFIIVYDIILFCKQRGIFIQGRGSAANSVVCYSLGITNVDPVGMDLLFERFLSAERAEYPDIDLDIASRRREEVLQYVFSKYGTNHAAMVCNVVTFRRRLAVREVGRVLGVDTSTLDKVGKAVGRRSPDQLAEALSEHGLRVNASSSLMQRWAELSSALKDVPRHLSIHTGGVIISAAPLAQLVPIEPASMEGRRIIQWDKDSVAAAGLCKVDLLGLGMLEVLQNSLEMASRYQGWDVEPAQLSYADPYVYERIQVGDTVGVFQIESRAQISSLPRMRPRKFYDLVVQVAIIRPGPIQGDMVHPYLRRRSGKEQVTYLHPDLEPILARTLGVPLFQEQIMKIAVQAAGLTPGRADALRRAMGSKRSVERMEELGRELIDGMLRRGIELPIAAEIFKQLSSFASYGFPESHAASFALLVYLSAWMKYYCPEVYLCAMLNAQPMGFYSPATLIADAERHGVEVLGLCAQRSGWGASIELVDRSGSAVRRPPEPAVRLNSAAPPDGKALAVRLGFSSLRSAGPAAGARFEAARGDAPFSDPIDFVQRSALSSAVLEEAAWAGAFSAWGLNPRDAAWQIPTWLAYGSDSLIKPQVQRGLFELPGAQASLLAELAAVGAAPKRHAVELFAQEQRPAATKVAQITEHPSGVYLQVFGLITSKQSPGSAKGFVFLTLEDETGTLNVIIHPKVFERHRAAIRGAVFLWIGGELQRGLDSDDKWGLPINLKARWVRSVAPPVGVNLERSQRVWG